MPAIMSFPESQRRTPLGNDLAQGGGAGHHRISLDALPGRRPIR
jgi:hypothetical protein